MTIGRRRAGHRGAHPRLAGAANIKAARDAGFAYEAYVRLKLASVRSFVSQTDHRHPRRPPALAVRARDRRDRRRLGGRAGVTYAPSQARAADAADAANRPPGWVEFLLAFDVDYRKRRLRFLIEGQNRLYQMLGSPRIRGSRSRRGRSAQAQVLRSHRGAGQRVAAAADDADDAQSGRGHLLRGAVRRRDEGDRGTMRSRSPQRTRTGSTAWSSASAPTSISMPARATSTSLLAETEGWPRARCMRCWSTILGFPFWDVLTFAGDAVARGRRVQRDPGRSHQRAGREPASSSSAPSA